MPKVEDLNIAQCKVPESKPNILTKPPSCSSGRDLRYEDSHSEYKGPFRNLSNSMVPGDAVPSVPSHAMMALSSVDLPKEWSWHKTGGNKIEDGSRNQGSCGCCWAMSFVSALGDRYALKYNISTPHPSTMQLVSCGGPEIGKSISGGVLAQDQCGCGSNTWAAALWLEQGGTVGLESCWPYSTFNVNGAFVAPNCPKFDSDCCSDCCGNPASKPKFSVKEGSTKFLVVADDSHVVNVEATINAIKQDIMGNGPVVTTFWVPSDFAEWWQKNAGTTNIYKPSVPAPPIGTDGHSVVLSGWGIENGVGYWEMRNTWGSPGFCRFAMATSLDKNKWTGIDIPVWSGGTWTGGAISVEPGPLSDYDWDTGKGGWGGTSMNWKQIGVVLGIVLAIVLIVFIIMNI
jgi:hypothetical protein